jgi:hypothetical protein
VQRVRACREILSLDHPNHRIETIHDVNKYIRRF